MCNRMSVADSGKKLSIAAGVRQFHKRDVFTKEIQKFLSTMVTKSQELRELTRAFREMDTNSDGCLDQEEFKQGMKIFIMRTH